MSSKDLWPRYSFFIVAKVTSLVYTVVKSIERRLEICEAWPERRRLRDAIDRDQLCASMLELNLDASAAAVAASRDLAASISAGCDAVRDQLRCAPCDTMDMKKAFRDTQTLRARWL